jgi:carbon monoxide dehydrogenase subunit G
MKYSVEIELDAPVEKVVALFDQPGNMKHWMPNMVSFEALSGTPGQVGAKSLIKFQNKRKVTTMTETVLVRDLPREFSGSYEFQGITYVVKNHFIALSPDKTRYVSDQDFQLTGLMKLFGLLMPWMFKRESMKHMAGFKAFVERS